ncbi:cytochrome c class I [Methylobacterium sp. 4-46]|uniref:c-type cytochrome n=1 Tax=unclassified Methylobacterium TaxID=2615210 RepID=UPI000152CB95|nr:MULTISPECIES: cytochrome c [Methylobacterium]ACA15491.1 cytochrome c class I [Methylobacterium sp. 4-46]WFT81208.1 cytochrome c [Methylobacterium nodulans]
MPLVHPRFPVLGAVALGLALAAGPARAVEDPHLTRGRNFVRTHCAGCHAVGRTGESPLPEAPRFRDLHTRYPVAELAESLAEGITTGHPTMPEFRLDPDQVEDVIRYLSSLE